jgi:hypothetical protein
MIQAGLRVVVNYSFSSGEGSYNHYTVNSTFLYDPVFTSMPCNVPENESSSVCNLLCHGHAYELAPVIPSLIFAWVIVPVIYLWLIALTLKEIRKKILRFCDINNQTQITEVERSKLENYPEHLPLHPTQNLKLIIDF